jgi:hypothetical protein
MRQRLLTGDRPPQLGPPPPPADTLCKAAKAINITAYIYKIVFILHFVYSVPCCPQALQTFQTFPAPHKRRSWPVLI